MLTKLNLILVILFAVLSSCVICSEKTNISAQFLNNVTIEKQKYLQDSITIIGNLKQLLKKHEDFFFSKEYFDSTILIVDTIIYSPDFKKMAIFVITKNPTNRQLAPDNRSLSYYNGTCYLGFRNNNSISVNSIGPHFTNSIDQVSLSKEMKNTYFTIYARFKDVNGRLRYKYNIGDVRFWTCPIWQEVKDRNL